MGDGSVRSVATVTDGTSNTVTFGEATPTPSTTSNGARSTVTDGTSNTVGVPERPPQPSTATGGKASGVLTSVPVPTCAVGTLLAADTGSFGADGCVSRIFSAPADPISIARR
jgi:hypothetical protein